MYYTHFSLTGPPFESSPTPEKVYLSQTHRECRAALEWGLLYETTGLTLLTGEPGTGKTTLVYSILLLNFAQVRTAYVPSSRFSFEDLLRVILDQLAIRCERGTSKLDLIEALIDFLKRLNRGEKLAVIIDEAQGLSDDALEEFRLLANHGQRVNRYLQLILVGQPSLTRRLKQPTLRQIDQRIASRAILRRLSTAEAAEYVTHCLRTKGGQPDNIFEWRALRHLLRHGDGTPRKINVLCHNAMLIAYGTGASKVDLKIAKETVKERGDSLLATFPAIRGLRVFDERALIIAAALGFLLVCGGYAFGIYKKSLLSNDSRAQIAVVKEAPFKPLERAPIVRKAMNPAIIVTPETGLLGPSTVSIPDLEVLWEAMHQTTVDTGVTTEPESAQPIAAETLSYDSKQTIVVRDGDTLEKLAIQYFGSRRGLKYLVNANPQLMDINRIRVGQILHLSPSPNSTPRGDSPHASSPADEQ